MRLHLIPSEKFTTNILCVLLRRPLRREEVTKNALLPALLARGTESWPSLRDIKLAAEAMQGAIFDAQIVKKGEFQILQFFLESVDGEAPSLDFLHEIIMRPRAKAGAFHPDYLTGEAKNLQSRIEGRINDKSEYAKLLCIENMCEQEAFGIYGDGYIEDIEGITAIGLMSHYEKIRSPENLDLFALGKWDESWLREEVNKRFAVCDGPRAIESAGLQQARKERQIIKQDHGSTQGQLCMGLRGQVPPLGADFVHFQLANEILGGGPNAKLFTKIREKESLCYAIYSSIYRFKSIMCIQAGTEPDKLEQVYELAESEFEAMKQGKFSEEDINSAKSSLSKRWRAMQDNPSACVDFYASQYLLGDESSFAGLLAQVEKASHSGICKAASQLDIDTVVMMQ